MEKEFEELINTIKKLITLRPEYSREMILVGLNARETWFTYNPSNKLLKIKLVRCNHCGFCCMTLKPNSDQTPWGVDDEGKCNMLVKEEGYSDRWICNAGFETPFNCLLDPLKDDNSDCSIEHYLEYIG